jgi:nucleotidyltransferase substrate binding protein (TIGR01987 family)
MEKISNKLSVMIQALTTLSESIQLFNEYSNLFDVTPNKKNEQLLLSMRDSMIQRFEYCTDLFWKVIRVYLEDVEKLDLPINTPRVILREAVKARLLSEQEGEDSINMVESRNKTSHIYHQEVAQDIAHKIPAFYILMKAILDRIQKNMSK